MKLHTQTFWLMCVRTLYVVFVFCLSGYIVSVTNSNKSFLHEAVKVLKGLEINYAFKCQ